MGLTLGDKSKVRFYCLCPSYTATSQGPPVDLIKGSLGGVLRAEHMGEGFMMLVNQQPPNGSIMRVTARNGGVRVVHDLVVYGRELGGKETPREGTLMKEAPLPAVTAEESSQLDAANAAGRAHEGMQAPSRAKL